MAIVVFLCSSHVVFFVKFLIMFNVAVIRFTWRMKMLTGRRGVAILYAYMLLGLGFLRSVTPDFGDLGNREQELEGSFRLFFFCI